MQYGKQPVNVLLYEMKNIFAAYSDGTMVKCFCFQVTPISTLMKFFQDAMPNFYLFLVTHTNVKVSSPKFILFLTVIAPI